VGARVEYEESATCKYIANLRSQKSYPVERYEHIRLRSDENIENAAVTCCVAPATWKN
jgi:hypothetical protein